MAFRYIIGLMDCINGTSLCAETAAHTFFLIDHIFHEVLADMGRTLLVPDMRNIFITEMLQRGGYGICRRLAQWFRVLP